MSDQTFYSLITT